MSRSGGGPSGCGCVSVIVFILVLWMLWVGLPTPWGTYNVDIFPPRIWRVDQPAITP